MSPTNASFRSEVEWKLCYTVRELRKFVRTQTHSGLELADLLGLKLTPGCHEAKRQRRDFLHIDELEAETICKARGCRNQCRLAKVWTGETNGFVGGLAEMIVRSGLCQRTMLVGFE